MKPVKFTRFILKQTAFQRVAQRFSPGKTAFFGQKPQKKYCLMGGYAKFIETLPSIRHALAGVTHGRLEVHPRMLCIPPPLEPTWRARAAREHRSLSNMIEVLILDYGRGHGPAPEADPTLFEPAVRQQKGKRGYRAAGE